MSIKKILKSNEVLFRTVKKTYLFSSMICNRAIKGKLFQKKLTVRGTYKEISSKKHHVFFGYYDKSPWRGQINSEQVIYHKVPTKGDDQSKAFICLYDFDKKEEYILATTTAWNWQQGAMLQWFDDTHIIYNTHNSDGGIISEILDVESKDSRQFPIPFYQISSDRKYFITVNFTRLQIANTGYGYKKLSNSIYAEVMDDKRDGVWKYDITLNESQLLFSIEDVLNYNPKPLFSNAIHHINHLDFRPDSDDFIFIHRWKRAGDYTYTSRLILYNATTKEFQLLLDNKMVSHFCWRSPNVLLIYARDGDGLDRYLLLNVVTKNYSHYLGDVLKEDGHPSYIGNKTILLTDTYPGKDRFQKLYTINQKDDKLIQQAEIYSPIAFIDFERCDLHPRWEKDGDRICVDTSYTGRRSLLFINSEKE